MTQINNQITQGLKSKSLGFMRTKEILLLATINQLTMRKIFVFIFSLFFFTNSFAQKNKTGDAKIIDSLKQLYNKKKQLSLEEYWIVSEHYLKQRKIDSLKFFHKEYSKEALRLDNEKHKLMNSLIKSQILSNEVKNDSAITLIKSIFDRIIKYPELEYKANFFLSYSYRGLSKLDSAQYFGNKSLQIAKKEDRVDKIISSLSNLYQINAKDNFNHLKSLAYIDSILIYSKNKKQDYTNHTLGGIYHQLGNFSIRMDDYEKTKYFYLESRKYYLNKNKAIYLFYNNNALADYYMAVRKLDSAVFYLNSNINHPEINQNKSALIKTYRRFVKLESIKNNNSESLKYITKTLTLVNEKSSDYLILIYYKAVTLSKLKRYRESNKALNQIPLSRIETFLELKKEYHKLKFENFSALRKSDSIVFHIEKYMRVKDSFYNLQKVNAIKSLQIKYETQQKENEILKLSNDNIKKEAEAKTKNTQLTYSLFGGGAVLLLSLFTLRAYRKERKSKEQIAKQKQEIETLHKEVHHRVKNNLAVAKSFTSIAKENVHDKKGQEALNALQSRIDSMASVHEILYKQDNISAVNFQSYTERICEEISKAFDGKKRNINFSVEANVQIPINEAIPLGLVLNEAVTNSFKYAFKGKEEGTIAIKIAEQSSEIKCTISDDGVGMPKDFNIEELNSYGMELIQTLVMQLEGSLEIKNKNGTQINITIPKS